MGAMLRRVAVELVDLVAPGHTVLVTQECQNGIIGEGAPMRELAEAAAPMKLAAGRLAAAARQAGVTVVHCLAWHRADFKAASSNARMLVVPRKLGMALVPGSDDADVVPEIGVDDADIVLGRYHGLGPMGGTELDMVCRNLGATTIIGVGVSVNVGMLSLGLDAVNHGYQFVVPRDAVTGVPEDYIESVLTNSFAMFGTVSDVDSIVAAWTR